MGPKFRHGSITKWVLALSELLGSIRPAEGAYNILDLVKSFSVNKLPPKRGRGIRNALHFAWGRCRSFCIVYRWWSILRVERVWLKPKEFRPSTMDVVSRSD
jgi:hypothetical protein